MRVTRLSRSSKRLWISVSGAGWPVGVYVAPVDGLTLESAAIDADSATIGAESATDAERLTDGVLVESAAIAVLAVLRDCAADALSLKGGGRE